MARLEWRRVKVEAVTRGGIFKDKILNLLACIVTSDLGLPRLAHLLLRDRHSLSLRVLLKVLLDRLLDEAILAEQKIVGLPSDLVDTLLVVVL